MAQTNVSVPSLPLAPREYDPVYQDKFANVLRLFFNQINSVGPLAAISLNLSIDRLPTDADYVDLRSGDVYRDTATNVLKIKV